MWFFEWELQPLGEDPGNCLLKRRSVIWDESFLVIRAGVGKLTMNFEMPLNWRIASGYVLLCYTTVIRCSFLSSLSHRRWQWRTTITMTLPPYPSQPLPVNGDADNFHGILGAKSDPVTCWTYPVRMRRRLLDCFSKTLRQFLIYKNRDLTFSTSEKTSQKLMVLWIFFTSPRYSILLTCTLLETIEHLFKINGRNFL